MGLTFGSATFLAILLLFYASMALAHFYPQTARDLILADYMVKCDDIEYSSEQILRTAQEAKGQYQGLCRVFKLCFGRVNSFPRPYHGPTNSYQFKGPYLMYPLIPGPEVYTDNEEDAGVHRLIMNKDFKILDVVIWRSKLSFKCQFKENYPLEKPGVRLKYGFTPEHTSRLKRSDYHNVEWYKQRNAETRKALGKIRWIWSTTRIESQ